MPALFGSLLILLGILMLWWPALVTWLIVAGLFGAGALLITAAVGLSMNADRRMAARGGHGE